MNDTSISVTEAVRNFAECVNRVYYQQQSFVLLKNGVPFARLIPAGDSVCLGRRLAEVLGETKLPAEQTRLWNRDLKVARTKLKAPPDKWQC